MIKVIQIDNTISINGIIYQVDSYISASNPSGNLVQVTTADGHVQFKGDYSLYVTKNEQAFGANPGQVVTALNAIFQNSNPGGLIKNTDKITALAEVENFTTSSAGYILTASNTADGGILIKPLQDLLSTGDNVLTSVIFNLDDPDPLTDGRLAYDADKDTLVFQSEHGEIAIGETYKPVYNGTGSTISKGTVLKATGVQGERFTVGLFDASSGVDEELYLIGVAQADIPDATEGVVVSEGYVKHLNTSSYSVGTILYASETAGAFTSTKPSSPNLGIPIAMVTNVDGTNGTIYVRLTQYSHLTEAHDVNISSPSNGEVLTYNSTSGVWENAAAAGGIDTTGTILTGAIPVFTDSDTVKGDSNLFVTGGSLLTTYNFITTGTFQANNIILGSASTPTPSISLNSTSDDLEITSRGNVGIILDSDTNESGQKFSVNDPSTTERFSVSDLGVVRINDAYSFPTAVPNPGDILIAGAGGNTAWREPVFSTISKTGNFTLAATDCQQMIMCNSGAGFTIQIPTGLTKDAEVLVYQEGAGSITITAGSGVTLRNTSGFLNITAEQYAIVGLKHLGTSDVWVVTGERKPA